MNIVEGPAKVTQLIKDCINAERGEGGLLEEVVSFMPSYQFDDEIEEPFIGLFEQETTPVVDGTLSHKIELQTPFEFICIVYDDEDMEQSEIKGKKLACKVAATIARHFKRKVDDETLPIKKIVLDTIYTAGTADVEGKADRAVVTSIRISVNYYVDWMICYKNNLNGD